MLSSCGSYLIIDSENYSVQTKIEKKDIRDQVVRSEETALGTYEDFQKNFLINRRMNSAFHRPAKFNVHEEFPKINKSRIPLKNLVIRTTFSFWDSILGLIPFFSARTLQIEAEYSKWEAKRLRVDDLSNEARPIEETSEDPIFESEETPEADDEFDLEQRQWIEDNR